MKINGLAGRFLMEKYLGIDQKMAKRLEHSISVGQFVAKVAKKIAFNNPELNLDVDLCEFLGYCHDIGYSMVDGKHENLTIAFLCAEGIDWKIARMAMHGQLLEQFGKKEGNEELYMPRGIEGMILTYCDMSVRVGEPVSIKERALEIIERVKLIPDMPDDLKNEIEKNKK